MDLFLYYLVEGICNGAVIALIALGYTLVYGIIKLINFAHGEFYMVGAYAGFAMYAVVPSSVPVWLTILLLLLVAGIAGAIIAIITERIAYKPIRDSSRLVALLTAIGVSFFLQNLFKFVNSGNRLAFGGAVAEVTQFSVRIFGTGFYLSKFVFILVTVLLMVWLWYLVAATRFGRSMRAVSQDLDAARLMGIDVDKTIMMTFALGGFFAGVAGMMVGAIKQIDPMMGFMPGLIAFVAAVIGGIGSVPGAVIGGFLIGILQTMVVWLGLRLGYAEAANAYKEVAVFLLLIVVLVVRPQGILGRAERIKV